MTISDKLQQHFEAIGSQLGITPENLLLELASMAEVAAAESNLVQGRKALRDTLELRSRQRVAFLRNVEKVVEQQRQHLGQLAEISSLLQSYLQVLRREGKLPPINLPPVIDKTGILERLAYARNDGRIVSPDKPLK